jgi:hypothetical protein
LPEGVPTSVGSNCPLDGGIHTCCLEPDTRLQAIADAWKYHVAAEYDDRTFQKLAGLLDALEGTDDE